MRRWMTAIALLVGGIWSDEQNTNPNFDSRNAPTTIRNILRQALTLEDEQNISQSLDASNNPIVVRNVVQQRVQSIDKR